MREATKKSIRKLSNFRNLYIINSFVEKYYIFGCYPSGQDI